MQQTTWTQSFLQYLLAALICTVLSIFAYSFWQLCQHKWRVRKSKRARQEFAARQVADAVAAAAAAAGEDPDTISIPSSEAGPQMDPLRGRRQAQEQAFMEASSQGATGGGEQQVSSPSTSTFTTSSTGTVTTPTTTASTTEAAQAAPVTSSAADSAPAAQGIVSSVASRAANMFRSAAHAVGYPTGIPLDQSATGLFIRHDSPVPQAADYVRPNKRIVVKKNPNPPKTAPKPTRGRPAGKPPRPPGRPQSKSPSRRPAPPPRLASPLRRSSRIRKPKVY